MRNKKVAIVQSNYIPWKGYFDMIAAVDEFILYDDMQYTRRDWRNRNKIKTPNGVQWLTVPVKVKGNYHQIIRETEIDGVNWSEKHWKTIARYPPPDRHKARIGGSIVESWSTAGYRPATKSFGSLLVTDDILA